MIPIDEDVGEVSVDPDSPLDIPPVFFMHPVGSRGKTVVTFPQRASWCVLSEGTEARVFSQLAAGGTPATVLEGEHGSPIEDALEAVIVELHDKGLLGPVVAKSRGGFEHLKANLTEACNLRCRHCYRSSGEQAPDELADGHWHHLIEQHAALGGLSVTLSGGEPLMRLALVEQLLQLAASCRLQSVLLTNGVLADARTIERIAPLINEVQISIDGPTAAVAENVRGKGTWRPTLNAVDGFVRAGCLVRIAMTPLEENIEMFESHLPSFVSDITRRYGDSVMLHIAGTVLEGRCMSCIDPALTSEWTRRIEALRSQVLGPDYIARLDAAGFEPGMRRTTCGYAGSVLVEADGRVLCCDIAPEEAVGNIREDSLEACHAALIEARNRYGVDASPICSECDLRYICGGTCRIEDERMTGDPLQPSCSRETKLSLLERLVDLNPFRYEAFQ